MGHQGHVPLILPTGHLVQAAASFLAGKLGGQAIPIDMGTAKGGNPALGHGNRKGKAGWMAAVATVALWCQGDKF
jgi:hypothetical protein